MIDHSIVDSLQSVFPGQVKVCNRRESLLQIYTPFFHEDGDPLEVFLSEVVGEPRCVRFSDQALTLMRISCGFGVDDQSRMRVLDQIVAENGIENENGNLTLKVSRDEIAPGFLQFCQAVAKVSSCTILRPPFE